MNKETLAEYKDYLQIIPDTASEAYALQIATELMQEREAATSLIKRMGVYLDSVREVCGKGAPKLDGLITEATQWLEENGHG